VLAAVSYTPSAVPELPPTSTAPPTTAVTAARIAPTAAELAAHPVMLYDGVCNVCNASVQWVIRHDPNAIFRFAALQSPIARELLKHTPIDPSQLNSVILIDGARVLTASDALIAIARRLGPPWSFARVFQPLPRFVRDGVYRVVARNRYRMFGKREACLVPTEGVRGRFLDINWRA
jgi:predicted DCC family thiol-disulfide oxidoreductase YuxK